LVGGMKVEVQACFSLRSTGRVHTCGWQIRAEKLVVHFKTSRVLGKMLA
jgi:hypothetical protein